MTGSLDRLAAIATHPAMPVRTRVLLALLCHADPEGRAWPSVNGLARRVASTERTVRRALSDLEASGLIHCEQRGRGGRSRGMTVWTIAPDARPDTWQTLLKGDGSDPPCSPQRGAEANTDSAAKEGPPKPPFPDERGAVSEQTLSETDRKPCPKRPPEPSMNLAREPMEKGGRDPTPLGVSTSAELWAVMLQHGLRPTGNTFAIRRDLIRCAEERMTPVQFEQLVLHAKSDPSIENPLGLICHWIGTPDLWRDVLEGNPNDLRFKPTASSGPQSAGDVLKRGIH